MVALPPIPHGVDDDVLARAADALTTTGGLTFVVDGDSITYRSHDGRIRTEIGGEQADTVVRLSAAAWGDLVGQMRTIIGLLLGGDLDIVVGSFEQVVDWEPILRYLHAGIPPYDPTRADFGGRDPSVSFPADADDAELAAQLRTMGYLHVTGVFSPDEMAAANREIDRLASMAQRGDNESWWVTNEDGSSALCRLVYASLRSPVLAALERDPRIARLGTLLDPTLAIAPDRMEGAAVLLKVPGTTTGLSNIPWHQDCGTGGHAMFCPSVAVGIQLTGSSAETGNLKVVPGSHGQSLKLGWDARGEEVPVVSIDTEPGDVTIHIQDVMHASPPPTGAGLRRTMYVTHYPPSLWDHIGPGEALNDLVRNRTEQVDQLHRSV